MVRSNRIRYSLLLIFLIIVLIWYTTVLVESFQRAERNVVQHDPSSVVTVETLEELQAAWEESEPKRAQQAANNFNKEFASYGKCEIDSETQLQQRKLKRLRRRIRAQTLK